MGSIKHLPVPDPHPKPIAELLADIMERRSKAYWFDDRWPATGVRLISKDVPRLVKALEYAYKILRHRYTPSVHGITRILNGEEVDDN